MLPMLCAATAALAGLGPAQDVATGKTPKLVVLISIDQFRADYVERFDRYYLPARSDGKVGGFRFLAETGARFLDAHHNHAATETGPGHASLMTGSEPFLNGIVANNWFDRSTMKSAYCVDDAGVVTVGGTSKPMSARNLKVTTVGDELKMATAGKSRVVGISLKDRAAILMAGHAADTVIWFDSGTGNWVTSSFYAPDKSLPQWVAGINAEKIPDQANGKSWEPMLPDADYVLSRRAPAEKEAGNGKLFSHAVSSTTASGKTSYDAFTSSSFGQEYVFKTVEKAIEAEKLGSHEVPDVLVVNLATNDYVGHRFGPNSPEVMDMAVRTDRLLSDLFNTLQKEVPGGIDSVDVVVTADHGVVPIPEESADTYRTGVKRFAENSISSAVSSALVKRFGEGQWVLGGGMFSANLYLNRTLIAPNGLKEQDVEAAAAEAALTVPGVSFAFTRTQILEGRLPVWDWVKLVANGFDPERSGDVLVYTAPGFFFGEGTGTGHGVPWAYDTHVPILVRGPGIAPGAYTQTVHTTDIAPTLCHILGIEYPTGNVGHPLPALVSGRRSR